MSEVKSAFLKTITNHLSQAQIIFSAESVSESIQNYFLINSYTYFRINILFH